MTELLIHVNAALYIASFSACVLYVLKHRNNYRYVFAWKALVIGYVAVLYGLLAYGQDTPREFYRVAWFVQGWIPIVLAIALWGIGKDGRK